MKEKQTARIEGQKLSVLLEAENDIEGHMFDHIIELTGPSQELDSRIMTVKVIGWRNERIATLMDNNPVMFERAESSLDAMLTTQLLAYLLEGKTFYTGRRRA